LRVSEENIVDFYGIVGAGGFGREVIPLARRMLANVIASGQAQLVFVAEGGAESGLINGHQVLDVESFYALEGRRFFNVAIGRSAVRQRLSTSLVARGCEPFSVIAENVVVMDANDIAEGAILSPFVTVTSNTKIGKYFHANIYSYVAHDCVIGDFVTFAPSAKCNGNVVIEDHAYVGTGALIKQGSAGNPVVIGRGAVVGMGAVVTKSVPPHSTVIGNPARLMESPRA
jgi:sugar O-acyltransferase (sialic acid O-acetyltransferase NeuD family)